MPPAEKNGNGEFARLLTHAVRTSKLKPTNAIFFMCAPGLESSRPAKRERFEWTIEPDFAALAKAICIDRGSSAFFNVA